MTTKGLVFIDSQVDDYQHLLSGIQDGFKAFTLNSLHHGVEQITRHLKDFSNLESLHIITHGQPGQILLGDRWLGSDAPSSVWQQVREWSSSLAQQADIFLYGCQVGQGDRGLSLLNNLKQWTGANVAASSTLVGSSAKGGNWDLDVQTGAIAPVVALSSETTASYGDVLVRFIPNPMYGVTNNDITGEAELYIINLDTGASELVASIPGLRSFAMARESETGRVYFIETGNDPNVFFFDPFDDSSGVLDDSTGVATGGSSFLKMAQQAQTNRIFALDNFNDEIFTIEIDPNDPTGGGAATIAATITTALDPASQANPFTSDSGDMAFDPTSVNTLFVSVAVDTPDDPGEVEGYRLYSVDVSDINNGNAIATFVGDIAEGGVVLPTTNTGNLAFGQDGELYLTADGVLYQIDQDTGSATAIGPTTNVATGAALEFDDFATLPILAEDVDLSLAKTDNNDTIVAGDEISYTLTVTNPSNIFDIFDIELTDVVSADIENVSYTTTFTQGTGAFSDPSGTGNNIDLVLQLDANSIAQVTITGTVSSSLTTGTILSNTAQLELPPGLPDPDPDNNTSTDITTITDEPPGGGGGNPPGGGGGNPPGGGGNPPGEPCEDGMTLRGTNQGDRLTGGADADTILGRSGIDVLRGKGCDDKIDGGRGKDRIRGGADQDELKGRQDNDRINGGPGLDAIFGGLGQDLLFGRDGIDSLNGGRGDDVMEGNAGNDVMEGRIGDDVMRGGSDEDTMDGGIGDDVMLGGFGDDIIRGRQGKDALFGDAGDDRLLGGNESDSLRGGDGDDFLEGSAFDDFLSGGRGRDRLFGNASSDTLFGGAGQDILSGGIGKDRIFGQANDDQMFGGKNDDQIFGGGGIDIIAAGTGDDIARGGSDRDNISGNAGNDTLAGDSGNDTIRGNAGNDNMAGNAGFDAMFGGLGNDILNGGTENDNLQGGAGNDSLFGGSGRDFLVGGFGRDTLSGGSQNDALLGEEGNDLLRGNSGRDQFIVQNVNHGLDRVLDFEINTDFINFSEIFKNARYGQANTFGSYVRLVNNVGGTSVQVDANGDNGPGGFRTMLFLNDVAASDLRRVDFFV
ncbi:MAG: DUF4347 domain-containing protein [Elainellaceae cyanobacterium]